MGKEPPREERETCTGKWKCGVRNNLGGERERERGENGAMGGKEGSKHEAEAGTSAACGSRAPV